MNKRGQFFILASVIVSALIFSISMTVNQVNTYKEFNKIEGYSEIIDKEISQVQDYQIYNDIPDEKIEDFVQKLSKNLQDQDPSMNFAIFYGNKETIIVKNYGENGISVNEYLISGKKDNSGIITLQTGMLKTSTDIGGEKIIINPGQEISVIFDNKSYYFTIPEHNIVIFLLQQGDEDEQFVTIK